MGRRRLKATTVLRLLVVLLSVLLHGILGWVIVQTARRALPVSPAPPLEISLIAPPDRVEALVHRSRPRPDDARGEHPVGKAGKAPAPRLAASTPLNAAPGPTTQAPPVGPAPDAGVRQTLRSLLSCQPDRLKEMDQAARAACEAKLVSVGRSAPVIDAVPSEKRDYYDAVIATREARLHGPLRGAAAEAFGKAISPNSNHGGNISVGYHCTIRFGPGAVEANRRAGVRLGIPPCPITAPRGGSLQEVDPALAPP